MKPVRANSAPAKLLSQTPRQRELNTKRRGELAELTFVLKAASLGFGVARPYGDSERYDVILDARDLTGASPTADRMVPLCHSDRSPADAIPLLCHSDRSRSERDGAVEEPCVSAIPETRIAKRQAKRTRRRRSHEIPAFPPDLSAPLWRVQVKCSTQLCDGLYRVNAHRRLNGRAVPYLPGEIHFFAVYIIPEDTWYIIPLHATFGVTSLLFRRRADRRPGLYDAYREAWYLLRPK